jgi:hypothetical protein
MPGLLKMTDTRSYVTDQGRDFSCLAFDIRHLLALIPEDGPRLAWSVFPMGMGTEITWDADGFQGEDAEEFCWQVDESATGMVMAWQELVALAAAVHQTVWGTYVGCQSEAAFDGLAKLHGDDWMYLHQAISAYYEAVELAFQAVDSSFWLAYTRDDAVLQRISDGFQSVKTLRQW